MAEVQLTPAELRLGQESALSQGDKDPDDDGTFGIGGRCRLGLKYHWAQVQEKNALLTADKNPTLLLEELVAAQLYTGPMYLKYNNVRKPHKPVHALPCVARPSMPSPISPMHHPHSSTLAPGTALLLWQQVSARPVRQVQTRCVGGGRGLDEAV